MDQESSSQKQKVKKGLWSPEEDEKLCNYITKHGTGCWKDVPKRAGLQRCGKSCRLRWINYLRPDLKRGAFSPSEEKLIVDLQAILGNKWSLIATQLPGRTDNEIKNFWNSRITRRLRRPSLVHSIDKTFNGKLTQEMRDTSSHANHLYPNSGKGLTVQNYCGPKTISFPLNVDNMRAAGPDKAFPLFIACQQTTQGSDTNLDQTSQWENITGENNGLGNKCYIRDSDTSCIRQEGSLNPLSDSHCFKSQEEYMTDSDSLLPEASSSYNRPFISTIESTQFQPWPRVTSTESLMFSGLSTASQLTKIDQHELWASSSDTIKRRLIVDAQRHTMNKGMVCAREEIFQGDHSGSDFFMNSKDVGNACYTLEDDYAWFGLLPVD